MKSIKFYPHTAHSLRMALASFIYCFRDVALACFLFYASIRCLIGLHNWRQDSDPNERKSCWHCYLKV